jgi:histidine ammonia-lyase
VVVETMLEMLHKGVTPVVCRRGSVGASGDLAPMSQVALVIMGEGEAFYEGERMPGAEAMAKAGITPIVFEARDGLACINGSNVSTGIGELCDVVLTVDQLRDFQKYLVYSHAAGYGEPAFEEDVRAAMISRVNVLSKGHSGLRPVVVETMLEMLHKGVTPVVCRRGGESLVVGDERLEFVAEVESGGEVESIEASETDRVDSTRVVEEP